MSAIKQHYNFNNEERPDPMVATAAAVVCKPIFHKKKLENIRLESKQCTSISTINSDFAFFVQNVVVLYIFRVFAVEFVPKLRDWLVYEAFLKQIKSENRKVRNRKKYFQWIHVVIIYEQLHSHFHDFSNVLQRPQTTPNTTNKNYSTVFFVHCTLSTKRNFNLFTCCSFTLEMIIFIITL